MCVISGESRSTRARHPIVRAVVVPTLRKKRAKDGPLVHWKGLSAKCYSLAQTYELISQFKLTSSNCGVVHSIILSLVKTSICWSTDDPKTLGLFRARAIVSLPLVGQSKSEDFVIGGSIEIFITRSPIKDTIDDRWSIEYCAATCEVPEDRSGFCVQGIHLPGI